MYSVFSPTILYSGLPGCVTDDDTRTLDPHWWRVNKPFLQATEALLDYRPKESWLKGALRKRKTHGKKEH